MMSIIDGFDAWRGHFALLDAAFYASGPALDQFDHECGNTGMNRGLRGSRGYRRLLALSHPRSQRHPRFHSLDYPKKFRSATILAVRHNGKLALGGEDAIRS